MGVFRNGTNRSNVWRSGAKVNGAWTNGVNRLTDSGTVISTFEDAMVTFFVTNNIVSVNVGNGTLLSATYQPGHTFSPVTTNTNRTNNISVTLPNGDVVSGTLSDIQEASLLPSVVTNAASGVGSSSATLNGTITSTGGLQILDSGFFLVSSNTSNANTIINNGQYIHDGGSTGISESISTSASSTYSYVAGARNNLGWGYGSAVSFTTGQIPAIAQYIQYNAGQPTGGTLTSTTEGTWSAWTGGSNIQPTTVGSTPTSAICASDSPTCTLSRTRTNIDHYTGATQETVFECTITQSGAGTPTCSGDPVGTQQDGPDITVTRNVVDIETQTISVTNEAYEAPAPTWGAANIVVNSCMLDQSGNTGFATTNVGTASILVGSYTANNQPADRTVAVTFSLQHLIPSGYGSAGSLTTTQFTTNCNQPGVGATPMFTANSANVIYLGGGFNPVQSAANGGSVTVAANTGENYTVTAPSVSEGSAQTGASGFGAGTFSLLGGGRFHTFTLAGTTETYSFTVFAGGSSGGGTFF